MQLLELALGFGIPFLAQTGDSDGGGSALLLLLGPAAGVGFYLLIFFRYRNTDKRHAYERETSAEVLDLRVHDQVVSRVTGVERSSIQGKNSSSPRTRLGAGTRVTTLEAPPTVPPPTMQPPTAPPAASPATPEHPPLPPQQ